MGLNRNDQPFADSARHEAAHTVIGYLCGLKIHHVTIVGPCKPNDPNDSPCKTVAEGPAAADLSKVNGQIVIDRLQWALAGPVADAMAHDGKIQEGGLTEIHDVGMKHLLWADSVTKALAADAQQAIDDHPDDWKAAAAAFYRRHSGPVVEILESENAARAVDALARALIKHGKLSGFEAVSIIEKTWQGPRPERALPASEHPTAMSTDNTADGALESAARLITMAFEICQGRNPAAAEIILRAALDLYLMGRAAGA